tara:strand:+ start:38018 stop:38515 length:498 start_codon:yes stop_codon:yes gene_type:complete
MATYTEWWECPHCGGGGSITFDSRPGRGIPPTYGECGRCGYTFGCGENEDFTHPDSYEYLKTLHDINSDNYWQFIEEGADEDDWAQGVYTKDDYFRIIYDAGLEGMILNPINARFSPMTADEFFSDESCRLKVRNPNHWCPYCKSKDLLYQSPFMNWKKNPFEVK